MTGNKNCLLGDSLTVFGDGNMVHGGRVIRVCGNDNVVTSLEGGFSLVQGTGNVVFGSAIVKGPSNTCNPGAVMLEEMPAGMHIKWDFSKSDVEWMEGLSKVDNDNNTSNNTSTNNT